MLTKYTSVDVGKALLIVDFIVSAGAFIVFDIKTGEQLTEEDIFGQGFERKVGKLLDEKAKALRAEGLLPEENEFYNDWYIEPNGNFALTDSSIIYTFNPYEIAPYCYGIIDIEIMRSEE